MTQQPWGQQRPSNQQWGTPQQQWGTPQQQQWGAPRQGAPQQWGQAAWPQGRPGGQPVRPGAPGPAGQWQPPAPKGGNKLRIVLIAMLVALALSVVGLVVMLSTQGKGSNDPGGYKNENYTAPPPDKTPPPLPEPNTQDELDNFLLRNALYDQDVVVPVRCEAQDINLETASKGQLQDHMNEVVACLMRTWIEPIEGAGYQLPRPSVTVYTGQVQSRCGKLPSMNAVYCGADQQIYYASDLPDVLPQGLGTKRWTVESVIAHEFGHAVQARTGMLVSGFIAEDMAQGKQAKNAVSRRVELQADCFAGTFLHSIAQSKDMTADDLDTIETMFYSMGDDVLSGKPNIDGNHGHGQSRRDWSQTGMNATSIGQCNTYAAQDDAVR